MSMALKTANVLAYQGLDGKIHYVLVKWWEVGYAEIKTPPELADIEAEG